MNTFTTFDRKDLKPKDADWMRDKKRHRESNRSRMRRFRKESNKRQQDLQRQFIRLMKGTC